MPLHTHMSLRLAAVTQFCATSAVANNAATCCSLISQAGQRGAKAVFLPECSDFISTGHDELLQLSQPLTSQFLTSIREAARDAEVWVSLGVHEKENPEDTKVFNTHVLIDSNGHVMSTYRKLHLFDIDIKGGPRLKESDDFRPGIRIATPHPTPIGTLGLAICYDLRFPELALALRQRGAEILTYPAAFTQKTGEAHWETLLRARAIETQCYVIAAGQMGQHNAKRASYGHAMIVDPWGTVVAQCADTGEPELAIARIDLEFESRVRRDMPVLEHRRTNIYEKIE